MQTSNRAAREASKEKIRKIIRNADSSKVTVIPANKKEDFFTDTSPRNVAIYARVSTDGEHQTHSIEWQQKYYSDYVNRHEGWKLVKIYADEGISGTSLKKRDAFNEMIRDCEIGKIDLIVTKSVPRFARNNNDFTSIMDKLAALKPAVGVFFEIERLYSLDPNNEMPLGFLAILAQEESRQRSNLMKKRFEMNCANGRYPTPPLLGYNFDYDEKRERDGLVINEDEAATVRLVFYMYLTGKSTAEIAEHLNSMRRKTKAGNEKWSAGSVLNILKNERRYGAVLAGKTYTPNFRDHKSVKNRGESTQYFQEEHHDPIISRDDFLAVKKMISNAKYGGNTYLPKLKVNTDGVLRGFVSVNPNWGAFTAEDYCSASAVVQKR
ncbi:MAG: recombinase family protein [Defluviitaleaceae bacterium]|nr:recombinase family protein [Defluviitaleaceae bacterium]